MVTSLMHKLFLGELHRYYSGYNLVRIPFNKQLHALSSALYQKFAIFTVLLSSDWSRSLEHSVIMYGPIR